MSGRFSYEDGPWGPEFTNNQLQDAGFDAAVDTNRKIQSTANINIFPTENLAIKFSTLYSTVQHKTPDNSNNIYGAFSSALMSQLRKTKTNYEFLVQVSKTTPGSMDND